MVGPVAIFIYLMTVNIPLALVSLVPLILAVVVMGGYVSEYGRFDGPGEPIHYNAQFRYDRVYQRHETD